MTDPKATPSVTITSAEAVQRQLQASFQYLGDETRLGGMTLIFGIGLALALGAVLYCQGAPEKKRLEAGRPGLSIPAMSQHANEIPDEKTGGDREPYNRAKDADDMDRRKRDRARGRRAEEKFQGPVVLSRPMNVTVPPGTFVRAKLITGASNGLVKAVLLEAVSAQGEIVIDEGSTLVGQGSSTEQRLFIQFTKLIHRDGTVDAVNAEAADASDKTVGLKGSLVSSRATKLAAGIGLNFIAGASEALQDSQGQWGATIHPPTIKDAALQGTAQAALGESQEVVNEMKNTPMVMHVPEGTEIYLLFDGK